MKGLQRVIRVLCLFFNAIAGVSLSFLMFLTIGDIILRYFNMPIKGTYEMVAYAGAIVIGFSLPLTSWTRGHIFVDFLVLKFSRKIQNIFNVVTRCIVLVLFLLIGWNLIKYGMSLHQSGEVSLTLHLPFYPIAYGVGICCFIQCLVMISDLIKIGGGEYE